MSMLQISKGMKPEVKSKWVEALRSGKYKQTDSYLHTTTGFCCLGVLCEVALKNGLELEVVLDDNEEVYSYNDTQSTLPIEVQEWAGLTDDNPIVKTDTGDISSLAELNDSGYLFSDIADIIERAL